MKKFLSLLLSVVMLTSVAQLSAFADIIPNADNASSTQTTVNTEDELISDETEETTVATESESVVEPTTQPADNTYDGAVEYADEDESSDDGLVEKSILGYYNGYTVKVSGRLPEVATLSLTSVDDESANQLVSEMEKDGKAVFACDIKVLDENGNEWQPEEHGLDVTITGIDLPEEQKLQFLHISEDIDSVLSKNNTVDSVETIGDVSYNEDKEATFKTYGFSTFVGFTVEFHYNGEVFTMAGETEVLLSTIFSQLQIQKNVADVTDVTFSDTSLLTVEHKDGDWLLTSLEPFSTNEALNIKFSNGETLNLLVTDYAAMKTIEIGGSAHKEDTSGTNTCGLKIDYTTTTANGLGSADTYNFSGKVASGQYLRINFGGTVRLGSSSGPIRVASGAKLDIRVTREAGGEPENAYLSPGAMSVESQLIYVETGGHLNINANRTTSAGTQKYLIIDGRNLKEGGAGSTEADFSNKTMKKHLIHCDNSQTTDAESDIFIRAVQIKNFTSTEHRAIHLDSARPSVEISMCKFDTIKTGTSGGVIRFGNAFKTSTITLNKNEFKNCTVTGDSVGAAISFSSTATLNSNGTATISNCDFNTCTAPSGGGAIAVDANQCHLNINNCNFNTCTTTGASGSGGAIRITNPITTLTLDTNTFTKCTSKDASGAVGITTNAKTSTLNFDNNTFTNCNATNNYGAVGFIGNNTNALNFRNNTFNTCKSTGASFGAVGFTGDMTTINFTGNKFTSCSAPDNYGAVGFSSNGSNDIATLNFNNNTFSSCSSTNGNNGAVGVARKISTKLDFQNNTFNSCKATGYGAVGFHAAIQLINAIGYNTFISCQATNGSGGAIGFSDSSNLVAINDHTIQYNAFVSCTATKNGGAIAFHGNAQGSSGTTYKRIVLRNNAFLGCKANDSGGALYFNPDGSNKIGDLVLYYNNNINSGISGVSFTYNGYNQSNFPAVFYQCEAALNNVTIGRGRGGAIDLRGNITLFTINTYGGNTASVGSGFNKILMQECEAKYGYGGGIYAGFKSSKSDREGAGMDIKGALKSSASASDGVNSITQDLKLYENNKTELTATFKECKAIWGGAISEGGPEANIPKMNIAGAAFKNCEGMEGSALLLRNSDAGTVTTSSSIHKSIFYQCKTYDGNNHGDDDVLGGTIRTHGNASIKMTLENCSITNNYSHYAGGGIYWNTCGTNLDSQLILNNSMVQSNHAQYYGGGIYSSGDIKLNDSVVNHNDAGNTGGGICHGVYSNPDIRWAGDSVDLILGDGMTVNGNTAGRYGGGIAIITRYSVNKFATDLDNSRKMTITFRMQSGSQNPSVQNNVAGRYGGGIYYGIGDGVNDKEYATTSKEPSGSYVFTNSAKWSVSEENKQWLVDKYIKKIDIQAGTIAGNVAGIDGGGIYAKGKDTTINVTNGTITNNAASTININHDNRLYYTIPHGATNYTSNKLIINKGTYAGHGGGICLKGEGTVCNVNGGKIGSTPSDSSTESTSHANGNKADLGGGIAVMKGKIVLGKDSTIQYNYAHAGAGMYTYNGGAVEMNGGNVNYNHADSNDTLGIGACSSTQATIQVSGSSDKTPSINTSTTSVNDVEERDFVSGSGGAVYANGATTVSGLSECVNLKGGNVENNTASGGAGGGIFVNYGGNVTVDGGIIRYNSAKGTSNETTAYHSTNLVGVGGAVALGGGLADNQSVFKLTDSTITNGKFDAGIYSNTAEYAAADVYASGLYTKLDVPQALDMNLLGYSGKANGWYEDYHNSDSRYIPNGNDNKDNVGRYTSQDEIVRYSEQQNRIINDVNVAPVVDNVTKQYVNQENTYVCMTLGISAAGVFQITKHVVDCDGNNIDTETDEKFKFTVTSTDTAFDSDIKYVPTIVNLYDDVEGLISTDQASPEHTDGNKTLIIYLEAGQTALIKGTGTYSITEDLNNKQKTYVVSTQLKRNSDIINNSESIGGATINDVMAEGYEAEFTNTVKTMDIVIKYYDRKIVDGQPSDINEIASSFTKRYIGEDLYTGEVVDIGQLITKTGVWATKNNITNNVVDEYSLFTTQSNAVSTVNGKFYPGTNQKYSSMFPDKTQYHNDAHGNPTDITDYWVNYYNGDTKVEESTDIETGTSDNINNCLNVTKVETWLFNQPKQYTVSYHTINETNTTNLNECTYNDVSTIDPAETAAYTRYVATTSADNQKVYYNQRLGNGSGNEGTSANTPHLDPYGINGYTDETVTSTREITYDNKDLIFAYWSFDADGKTIASTDYEYNYRITKDTELYAVYLESDDYTTTRYAQGVTVYANQLDEFYGENGVAKTRLNTVLNPYNFNENDSSINYFGAVYVVPEKGASITPDVVNDLRTQISSKLAEVNAEDKGFFKVTIAGEEKSSNYYVYVRGDNSLTNKNRAQFSISFANTSLVNKRILAFGALKTDSWMISDNCIDYQFDDEYGVLLENYPVSIHKYE